MYSGITSGRVLNGELLYTKILEVNLFAFAYSLFRRDFSPLNGTYCNMKETSWLLVANTEENIYCATTSRIHGLHHPAYGLYTQGWINRTLR